MTVLPCYLAPLQAKIKVMQDDIRDLGDELKTNKSTKTSIEGELKRLTLQQSKAEKTAQSATSDVDKYAIYSCPNPLAFQGVSRTHKRDCRFG